MFFNGPKKVNRILILTCIEKHLIMTKYGLMSFVTIFVSRHGILFHKWDMAKANMSIVRNDN